MRHHLAIACGLAILPWTALAQSPVPKAIIGQYVITAAEENGTKLPKERTGQTVRITTESITVVDNAGKDIYVAKYALSTDAKPYKIAMTATGGPSVKVGETAKGLIEQEGETVRLVYAPETGVVPTEFTTKPDAKQLLFVMKKKQP